MNRWRAYRGGLQVGLLTALTVGYGVVSNAQSSARSIDATPETNARKIFDSWDKIASGRAGGVPPLDRWDSIAKMHGLTPNAQHTGSDTRSWSKTTDEGSIEFVIIQGDYFLTFIPSEPERVPDPLLAWMLQGARQGVTVNNGDFFDIQLPRESLSDKGRQGERYVSIDVSASGKLSRTEVHIFWSKRGSK